jgi:uncharacterized membrane protein
MKSHTRLGRKGKLLAYALAGLAVIVILVVWRQPMNRPKGANGVAPVAYKDLQAVLERRCYSCHGEKVRMKNIRLDAPQYVKAYAQYMMHQVVVSRLMPQNNATGMTEEERLLIKRWFDAGAGTNE